jgi:hypothetical protein
MFSKVLSRNPEKSKSIKRKIQEKNPEKINLGK